MDLDVFVSVTSLPLRLLMESSPEKATLELRNAQSAMATPTPKIETSAAVITKYNQLTACLDRLKEELSAFCTLMEQNQGETVPLSLASNSALPPSLLFIFSTRKTFDQQLETIQNLRTALAEAETALETAREADFPTRKLPARVENELAELRSQYGDHQRVESVCANDAARLIRTMGEQNTNETAAHEKIDAVSNDKDGQRDIICGPAGDVHEAINFPGQFANRDVDAIIQLQGTRQDSKTQIESPSTKMKSSKDKVNTLEAEIAIRADLRRGTQNKSLNACIQQLLPKARDSMQACEYQLEKENGDEFSDVDMNETSPSQLLVVHCNVLRALESELVDRQIEVQRLKEEVVALKYEDEGKKEFEVEAEEDKPDFDSKETKVMNMEENPLRATTAPWTAEIEMRQLNKRRKFEAGLSENELMSNIGANHIRQEVHDTLQECGDLKRGTVIGDSKELASTNQSDVVQNAVSNLFGWSMKVYGTMCRLSSIYAEGPEEVLQFGINEKGTMSLLDSAYAQKLHSEMHQFVCEMDSIPAFLAHVTTKNFEKTTAFRSQ